MGKTLDKDSVRVGDVVLVHDTKPRGSGSLPESLSSYQDRMGVYVVLY